MRAWERGGGAEEGQRAMLSGCGSWLGCQLRLLAGSDAGHRPPLCCPYPSLHPPPLSTPLFVATQPTHPPTHPPTRAAGR